MTLAALSEQPVHTSLWDLKDEVEMGHIQLSREADLVVVCPATADLLAKMAAGIADDLATTLLLATDKPVLAAPAMNVRMWQHAATRRNVARLRARRRHDPRARRGRDGLRRIWARAACPSPRRSSPAIEAALGGPGPLAGRHVIVTAGPTHEPIDPVRVIANRSSGKQGFAIAEALAGARRAGDPGRRAGRARDAGRRRRGSTSRRRARWTAAVDAALPADAAVLVAAVADWRVEPAPAKLKKARRAAARSTGRPIPTSSPTSPRSAQRPAPAGRLRGRDRATSSPTRRPSATRKGCDWIVANDVSGDVMGGDANQVHLITADGVEDWEQAPKAEVARRLAGRIAEHLTRGSIRSGSPARSHRDDARSAAGCA